MNNKRKKKNIKRTYEKPVLRIVELAAEEVLGVGCKSVTGTISPLNPTGCISVQCVQQGS